MKKFFKVLLAILVTALGLFSILFTIPLSRTGEVQVDFGTVVVAAVFIAYSIAASYLGSVLALATSFMSYSRRVVWFLSFSYIFYALFVLNNLIAFLGGGSRALLFLAPIILYSTAAFRLFIKLGRGRA